MTGAYGNQCSMCGSPTQMGGMGTGYGFAPYNPYFQSMYGQGFGCPTPMYGQGFGYPTPMYGQGFGYQTPMTGWGYQPGFYGGMGWAGGIPTDEQIRDMIYDSIDADPAVPYDADIDVDVTGGVVTLTGTVPNKRVKHDVGDDAWWVPGVWDINNMLEVASRAKKAGTRAGKKSS